jgi:hypothetical protein
VTFNDIPLCSSRVSTGITLGKFLVLQGIHLDISNVMGCSFVLLPRVAKAYVGVNWRTYLQIIRAKLLSVAGDLFNAGKNCLTLKFALRRRQDNLTHSTA